ncbi:glucose inhibited division protein A, putative [Eimeria tenella]|uniref:Glucose inhibited division protein A, putative n=1 Tax=Eimeria tenella TaxID=5802 RepID=U6L2G2_EIMTE|nr:glucose inhibited division protein A, putative [Eimeria tenella]CDJ43383.1 glucose inhibited division protein A, putative [Eimeria tenella]|eukprot:XP_013234133.1 glucose inhibited division protein A, putative [Eimeria tenella]
MQQKRQQRLLLLLLLGLLALDTPSSHCVVEAAARQASTGYRSRCCSSASSRSSSSTVREAARTRIGAAAQTGSSPLAFVPSGTQTGISSTQAALCSSSSSSNTNNSSSSSSSSIKTRETVCGSRLFCAAGDHRGLSNWQQAPPAKQRLLLRRRLEQLQQQQREQQETDSRQRVLQRHIRSELERTSSDLLDCLADPEPQPQQQQQQQQQAAADLRDEQQRRRHRRAPALRPRSPAPHPQQQQQQQQQQQLAFDVVVVGGGHAGVEAGLAAARVGAPACVVTPGGPGAPGALACNPSVGGSGKSQLLQEADACGALLGRAADLAAVHWRVLNLSRGPAAWAPRAQLDRRRFAACMQRFAAALPGLVFLDAAAEDILTEPAPQQQQQQQQQRRQRVCGVRLADGREIRAAAVVLAAGTFLDAAVAVGSSKVAGGRMHSAAEAAAAADPRHPLRLQQQQQQRQQQQQQQLPPAICNVEPAAKGLAKALHRLGLQTTYFKTGTPARLLGSSVDFSKLERQPSDPTPRPFSGVHTPEQLRRRSKLWVNCFVGHTNKKTSEIVKLHLQSLPQHRGDQGRGVGPRYCPSIANKVLETSRKRHTLPELQPQIFELDF